MTKLSNLICFIVLLCANVRGAVVVEGSGGAGNGGAITGAYSFSAGFSTLNATNVFLNPAISNLVGAGLKNYATNIATLPTIFTNIVYVNATGATTIINGTLLTNAMKTLPQFSTLWVGPGDYWNPVGTIPSMAFAADNRRIHFMPGARWIVGEVNGDPAYVFDDFAGKRTNIAITGHGTFISTNMATADIMYLEAGSSIGWECDNAWMVTDSGLGIGGGAILSWAGGVSNNVRLLVRDTATAGYDLIYGNASDGTTVAAEIGYAESTGDMLETTDDSPQWGLINVHLKRALTMSSGQPSAAIVSGRATLQVDEWEIRRPASLYSFSTATNGLIIGGNWKWTGSMTGGVVHAVQNSTTALRIKNANISYAGAFDPFYLTNATGTEFTVENVSLTIGSGPTNWVRGKTPSNVRVVGALSVNRAVGVGANSTLTGTNIINSLVVMGAQTNAGTLNVAGATTIGGQFTGSGVKVTGILDVDGEANVGALIATNVLVVPYAAGSGGVEGELVFDFDLFASGRGALKTFDGTADTVIVGVLASDSPSNGQVPKYNSASGTITWEADNNSGSGGSNFVVSSHGLINVTNGINIGAATRYQIKADSGLFYIYDTVSGEAPIAIDDATQLVSLTDGLSVQGSISATATNFSRQVKLTGGQAASSIVRTDSGTNLSTVTIGSGLSFDGTTLTASGGGGATSNDSDFGFNKLFGTPTKVLVAGDSITQVGGVGGTNITWAMWLTNFYTFTNLTYHNVAVSGSQYYQQSNAVWSAINGGSVGAVGSGTNGIFFDFAGINNMLFDPTTPSSTFVGWREWLWRHVRSNGFSTIVAFTLTDATNMTVGSANRTNWNEVNRLTRLSTGWNYLIEADRIVPFPETSAFMDGLHPSDQSQKTIAWNVLSQLLHGTNVYADAINPLRRTEGSNIFNLNGTNITRGLIPTIVLPTNTIVAAGSGTTVTPSSSGGVQTYTIASTATATPSQFSKNTWQVTPAASSTTLAYIGHLPAASGLVAATASSGSNPYSLTYYTTSTPNNASQVNENNAGIYTNKPFSLVFFAALTNTANVRVSFGASGSTVGPSESPTNTLRQKIAFLYSTNNGNWNLLTTTSTAFQHTDTGIAADTSFHKFRIDATPTSVVGYIDGVAVATNTLAIPTTTTLQWYWAICTIDGTTNGLRIAQHYGEQDL